jgi:hypothetical protein
MNLRRLPGIQQVDALQTKKPVMTWRSRQDAADRLNMECVNWLSRPPALLPQTLKISAA